MTTRRLAALAGLSALGHAAPAATPTGTDAFSLSAVPNSVQRAVLDIVKAPYLKYNVAFNPTAVVEGITALQSGAVSATPPSGLDIEYLVPVEIGTPAQTLQLDFDTGSADLWVFSPLLPTADQSGHNIYNPAKSSTAKLKKGYNWTISYADTSSAGGIIYTDKVKVGNVTATSQAVEVASVVATAFATGLSDGLLGLAMKSENRASPKSVKTFFNNVGPSLPTKLFAANLKHQAVGSYDFGFIDSTKYTGSIAYTPIKHVINATAYPGFYEIVATGYAVGNASVQSSTMHSIVDTGTSLLFMDDDIVNAYYSGLTTYNYNYGYIVFDCRQTLPNLGIQAGGKTFYIPGSYLNYTYVFDYGTTPLCLGGLQSGASFGFNLLGDIFLKAVYAIFDVGNNRMGFAKQAGLPSS